MKINNHFTLKLGSPVPYLVASISLRSCSTARSCCLFTLSKSFIPLRSFSS